MIKTFLLLLTLTSALAAEISNSYSLLEKHASFNPDLKTEPVETHAVSKKESRPDEPHPVFRGEGRARIEMVKPEGPVVKHEMLGDQPEQKQENRIDNAPSYTYGPMPTEVAYPDIPYAPGYGYDNGYPANSYDGYGNGLTNYLLEPDTSAFSMMWSQVPDSRAIVGFVGRTIAWVINSMFVIFLGSLLTIGVCSYTNLCSIHFHGVGPIHEEMRSLMSMTPEKLEKISTAAGFVKNAIDKYQKIQKVGNEVNRKRRSIFG
ncbi:uncharacterized protein LOC105396319 isoform X1 [Plutella xylostella]|uniref:uncharacterized protein LOC105396319 isoform X1 n=1 Tax=Plutella xylostella TaxID=51655 RepID=UPI002032F226|nr:uncharacterized protein LOC105396319 isoform X1 [Plutella xylostella]